MNDLRITQEQYENCQAMLLDVIKHAARLSCHCQLCARHVEINRHWPSCIVGKAQQLLGQKVTVKAG
jgi:hypothetical protein